MLNRGSLQGQKVSLSLGRVSSETQASHLPPLACLPRPCCLSTGIAPFLQGHNIAKTAKSFEGDRRTLTTLISCPAFNTWAEETLRQEQPSFVRLLKTSPRLPLRNSKALYSLYGGECPIRGPGFLAAELCVACVNSPCDGIFKASAILRWHSDIPLHCRRAVFKGKRLAILAGRPLYIESLRSFKVLIVRRQMWQAEPKKNRKRFPPRAPSPRFAPYGVEWECLRLFFFFFSRCGHL